MLDDFILLSFVPLHTHAIIWIISIANTDILCDMED